MNKRGFIKFSETPDFKHKHLYTTREIECLDIAVAKLQLEGKDPSQWTGDISKSGYRVPVQKCIMPTTTTCSKIYHFGYGPIDGFILLAA